MIKAFSHREHLGYYHSTIQRQTLFVFSFPPFFPLPVFFPVNLPTDQIQGIHEVFLPRDQLHFGIVMVLALNIALMTPPVGACLFVACGISKLTLEQLSREIFPFIVVVVIVLFIIAFVPDIPLFLPRLFGYA